MHNFQGGFSKGEIDVTSSYAIPFEESGNKGGIWFIDHLYHEKIYEMVRKVKYCR